MIGIKNLLTSTFRENNLMRNHFCIWIPMEAYLVAGWIAKASLDGLSVWLGFSTFKVVDLTGVVKRSRCFF